MPELGDGFEEVLCGIDKAREVLDRHQDVVGVRGGLDGCGSNWSLGGGRRIGRRWSSRRRGGRSCGVGTVAEAWEEGGEERERDVGADLEEAFAGLRLLLLFAVRAAAVIRYVLFRVDGHKSPSVRDISVGISFAPLRFSAKL